MCNRQVYCWVSGCGEGSKIQDSTAPVRIEGLPSGIKAVAVGGVSLDGVYLAGPDRQPVFRALARLKTDDVADVAQIVETRVLKALARRGS